MEAQALRDRDRGMSLAQQPDNLPAPVPCTLEQLGGSLHAVPPSRSDPGAPRGDAGGMIFVKSNLAAQVPFLSHELPARSRDFLDGNLRE